MNTLWTIIGMIGLIGIIGTEEHLAPRLELLTPPRLMSTRAREVYVIGKTNAQLIELTINGEKSQVRRVTDSIFHFQIDLVYGLNEITLKPQYNFPVNSVDSSLVLEYLRAPDGGEKYKNLYPCYSFHDNIKKENCKPCHDPVCEDLTIEATEQDCLSCHLDFKNKLELHRGSEQTGCNTCHQLGSNLISSISGIAHVDNPCYQCHKDKIRSFDQEFIHGPVAGGSCTICHDSHGSRYEHGLVNAEEILCLSCHDFEEDYNIFQVQHEPFSRGDCTACHDPHATGNKWVLVKSSEELCLTCHDKDGTGMDFHRHPFNVQPTKPLKKNLELSPKGRLECISCHNPHSSKTEHLLRVDQGFTCIGCHSDKR